VVRAWYLGSSLVAFVGSDFECTKHLSGMGPVSLVPDGRGKGTFPYYLWGTWMCPPACNSVVPVWVWTFVWEWSSKPCTKECRFRSRAEDRRELPGQCIPHFVFVWTFLGYAFFHLFRSTLQGYKSIDCRPLTIIRDCLIYWPWHPLLMELSEYYCLN
jgi:hypothetical protein